MKVLIIGSGAREHAFAWKLAQSPQCERVYSSVSAAAITTADKIQRNIFDTGTADKAINFCKSNKIDLVVIGPEAPLAAGMADDLRAAGIKVFGAVKAGAMLEASKEYSKEFMQKYNIPTAAYKSFTDMRAALTYVETAPMPIVIKADGLAAGKGVNICQTKEDAKKTVNDFMGLNIFGESGTKVVIEEFLEGKEASIIAFVDGKTYKTLPVSRDHKRLLDGNNGPNTGGMGVYSPVADITAQDLAFIKTNVFDNFIKGINAEGIDYCGIIYAGIMKGLDGKINVLEFNARSGDPETQAILPLIQNDLLEIILACLDKKLAEVNLDFDAAASVCVTLAGGDYPQSASKGAEITGLDNVRDALIFHAGTKIENGKIYTNGGRVLSIVALGDNISRAREIVYNEISKIHFEGMQYRKDIGED
jgi:phosphoribosylamine--glycine ligase